jgi:hypothetical protein
MVQQLTKAIYQVMIHDSTLASMLTTFHGVPAVFTTMPMPEGHQKPCIVTEGSVRDAVRDSKTTIGHDILRDIRCYTDETGDQDLVEDIGLTVKELFHKHEEKLNNYMTDFSVVMCWADGPRSANVHSVDEYVYGRIVSLTIWLTRDQSTMEWPPL